jgi:hypothetical protein
LPDIVKYVLKTVDVYSLPHPKLQPRLGSPVLDFQTWKTPEAGIEENKNRCSRFIVSPVPKSEGPGPPSFWLG